MATTLIPGTRNYTILRVDTRTIELRNYAKHTEACSTQQLALAMSKLSFVVTREVYRKRLPSRGCARNPSRGCYQLHKPRLPSWHAEPRLPSW